MMLHTVNKSPLSHGTLGACLKVLGADDALLLIEDGVYGSINVPENQSTLKAGLAHLEQGKIFALKEDIQARGIESRLIKGIVLVDYKGFVELVVKYQSSMAWL